MANKNIRWAFNFSKWSPKYSDIMLSTTCIQSDEKERLSRFVFKKDFKSSLIGRLLMRKFVHEATLYPYNDIRFLRDERGKPVLSIPHSNLAFNVSHQGDYVVLAGNVGDILGVDVMKLEYTGGKSVRDFFHVMRRQFSENEWITIKNCGNEKDQIAMFCRHWCLKESYVKAVGVGITVNLQDISFKINTPALSKERVTADSELYVEGVQRQWCFEEMLINDEHCVAVARPSNVCTTNMELFREIDFDTVVLNAVPLLEQDVTYCAQYFNKLNNV